MPSQTYRLFARAMAERKQILCVYDGYPRELCPIILGYNKGQEVALIYQFAGQSRSGLSPGGGWKCLRLAKVSNVRLRIGPWRAGSTHIQRQHCVEVVDLDINPSSPYLPRLGVKAASPHPTPNAPSTMQRTGSGARAGTPSIATAPCARGDLRERAHRGDGGRRRDPCR